MKRILFVIAVIVAIGLSALFAEEDALGFQKHDDIYLVQDEDIKEVTAYFVHDYLGVDVKIWKISESKISSKYRVEARSYSPADALLIILQSGKHGQFGSKGTNQLIPSYHARNIRDANIGGGKAAVIKAGDDKPYIDEFEIDNGRRIQIYVSVYKKNNYNYSVGENKWHIYPGMISGVYPDQFVPIPSLSDDNSEYARAEDNLSDHPNENVDVNTNNNYSNNGYGTSKNESDGSLSSSTQLTTDDIQSVLDIFSANQDNHRVAIDDVTDRLDGVETDIKEIKNLLLNNPNGSPSVAPAQTALDDSLDSPTPTELPKVDKFVIGATDEVLAAINKVLFDAGRGAIKMDTIKRVEACAQAAINAEKNSYRNVIPGVELAMEFINPDYVNSTAFAKYLVTEWKKDFPDDYARLISGNFTRVAIGWARWTGSWCIWFYTDPIAQKQKTETGVGDQAKARKTLY